MPPRSSSPICERSLDLTLIGIGRRDIPQCSSKHFHMEAFYRTFSGGQRPSRPGAVRFSRYQGNRTLMPRHPSQEIQTGAYHAVLKKLGIKEERVMEYRALYEPSKEGGIVVTFPDFDRGVTQGETEPDAREMALDALCMMIREHVRNGEHLPRPRKPRGR